MYQSTFGDYYDRFTNQTLGVLKSIRESGTILDLGAGTGRFSIPLAKAGYAIIAVEKSKGMIEVMTQKSLVENIQFPMHHCSIAEYQNGKVDLAMAVFTVLIYITEENELHQSLQNISEHLNPGGFFFFDLANEILFDEHMYSPVVKGSFSRNVTVRKNSEPLYTYDETCSGVYNGEAFSYRDTFPIRQWTFSEVEPILEKCGLVRVDRHFNEFRNTGSTYHLYQKK